MLPSPVGSTVATHNLRYGKNLVAKPSDPLGSGPLRSFSYPLPIPALLSGARVTTTCHPPNVRPLSRSEEPTARCSHLRKIHSKFVQPGSHLAHGPPKFAQFRPVLPKKLWFPCIGDQRSLVSAPRLPETNQNRLELNRSGPESDPFWPASAQACVDYGEIRPRNISDLLFFCSDMPRSCRIGQTSAEYRSFQNGSSRDLNTSRQKQPDLAIDDRVWCLRRSSLVGIRPVLAVDDRVWCRRRSSLVWICPVLAVDERVWFGPVELRSDPPTSGQYRTNLATQSLFARRPASSAC